MRFTGVRALTRFSALVLSALLTLAFINPSVTRAHPSPHESMHGEYSEYDDEGHGSMHGGMHAHQDMHHDQDDSEMETSHHGQGYGYGSHHMKGHHGYGHMGMGHGSMHPGKHQDAIQFIDHILKFKEGMSLTPDQEEKLHAIKTQYQKDRIKMKANVQLANIDLHELLRDEQASLSEIENRLKQVHALKAELYMASIKAKRDAKGVLTAEQRSRMDKIHERIKAHGGNLSHAGGYSRGAKGKETY